MPLQDLVEDDPVDEATEPDAEQESGHQDSTTRLDRRDVRAIGVDTRARRDPDRIPDSGATQPLRVSTGPTPDDLTCRRSRRRVGAIHSMGRSHR
jgi:hypothetical protein